MTPSGHMVKHFPEVETGDMDPIETHLIESAMARAASAWLLLNLPETPHTDEEIRAAADDMQAEITRDMAAGVVPSSVRRFSELHDHVDANEYGGFTTHRDDWSTNDLIKVQDLVQEWLENR